MKFIIKYDSNGNPYWVLKGVNGEPICWSESYVSKAGVAHSIALVKDGAKTAPVE